MKEISDFEYRKTVKEFVKKHTDFPKDLEVLVTGFALEHLDNSHQISDLCDICKKLFNN